MKSFGHGLHKRVLALIRLWKKQTVLLDSSRRSKLLILYLRWLKNSCSVKTLLRCGTLSKVGLKFEPR